jgi:hypothetical protein
MLQFCNNCGGALNNDLDIGAWKARYPHMYDDQIGIRTSKYKHKRRAVIADTFDRLIAKQKAQWEDYQDDTE